MALWRTSALSKKLVSSEGPMVRKFHPTYVEGVDVELFRTVPVHMGSDSVVTLSDREGGLEAPSGQGSDLGLGEHGVTVRSALLSVRSGLGARARRTELRLPSP